MVYGVPPDEMPQFCDNWLDTEWMCWCVTPVKAALLSCIERLAWGTSVDMRA